LRDDTGSILGWYGQNTDVDDQRRAETLLAGEKQLLEMVASGEALSAVLDALCTLVDQATTGSHCSVLLIDETGKAVRGGAAPSLSPVFVRLIDGKPLSTPYWGPCAAAIGEGAPVIVCDIAEAPEWSGSEWGEMALALGLRSCWTTPILSRSGKPLGTFAIYQDEAGMPTRLHEELAEQFAHVARIAIERSQDEEALRRSQAFLTEAQRLSGTGSFSWRTSTQEIVWSEETYRIYEIDPAVPVTFELVGTRIHPDEAAWFGQLLGRATEERQDLEFEHRLVMPDGSVKYLHVVAHAALDRNGALEFIGAVQDVTERRRSEDALSKVRAELAHLTRITALNALTASIAHEVNQPLAGIITNASTSLRMLGDTPPNIDGARETARRTIRDANRAADVVARLRALFKRSGPQSDQVDLNDAVQEVLALSLHDLQRERVIVRTELADNVALVVADRVQLQQVVLNLVLNAVEAMRDTQRQKELLVQTSREDGDRVRVAVHDTGPGFDLEHADRLFDPFYTTKQDGMGVGLSISRSIIENQQGRLWVARNDASGATFAFTIPAAPASGGPRQ
jgi:signal transduction histidine kinase